MLSVTVVLVVMALAVVWLIHSEIGRTFFKFRGDRLVSCPETNIATAVRVSAVWAAVTSAFGLPRLRVHNCSRWVDFPSCEQACLWQIRAAPRDTLMATILRQWREGKPSIYGWTPVERVTWYGHKPGVAEVVSDRR